MTVTETRTSWHLPGGEAEAEAETEKRPHRWVAAANVDITQDEAEFAARKMRNGGVAILKAVSTTVTVLETHCAVCRMPWDRAVLTDCVNDERLRGGPVGTRKRRTPEPEANGA